MKNTRKYTVLGSHFRITMNVVDTKLLACVVLATIVVDLVVSSPPLSG